jgi:hypothetical protein
LYLGETEDEDGFYSLLKSSDGGAHWASIWGYNSGLQSDLNTVAVDPGNPATLYAGVGDAGSYAKPGSAGTGVIKSTDGGATWNATGLKDTAATLLVIDRADPSILYAGTQGIYTEPRGFRGLFKSVDSGGSWLAVNNGLTGLADIGATITALVIAPNHSNTLYAGTSRDGVYKSVDGAATWVKFNDGLTSLEIRALAVSPSSQNMLYAATSDGIFRLMDETPAPWRSPVKTCGDMKGGIWCRSAFRPTIVYYPDSFVDHSTLIKAILLFDELHFMDRPAMMFGKMGITPQ